MVTDMDVRGESERQVSGLSPDFWLWLVAEMVKLWTEHESRLGKR